MSMQALLPDIDPLYALGGDQVDPKVAILWEIAGISAALESLTKSSIRLGFHLISIPFKASTDR